MSMQKNAVQRCRPRPESGAADPVLVLAFGEAVRSARTCWGPAQGPLAYRARVEGSHGGKIERAEHMPTRSANLKIAGALGTRGAELATAAEALLLVGYQMADTDGDPRQSAQPRRQAGTDQRWHHQKEHIGSFLLTLA